MWLIRAAMQRPITILIVILGVALTSLLAVQRMKIDIFPDLGTPVIYVAQPYGGMDPAQMEGYIANYYEYHFLYITGIEHVESKSIQGATLLKLFFHEGTDMSQAMAETVGYVNRSRAFMPPGTVPPFVTRFDGGSVPVGYLVFSSETRALGEIQDLALNRIRPMFGTLPGVSAPPPFGGNQRTVVVRVDPDRLRAYRMSGEEVVQALSRGNVVTPSGNVRIGDFTEMVPANTVVRNVQELLGIPVRVGAGATVFLRDVGYVEDSSDILTSYALINGKRSVYIPVTKRADASTLSVVQTVTAGLPRMRAAIPDDIDVNFAFDQSGYVTNAIRSLVTEGTLGALLTGVMVLLFLGHLRSSIIVILTIPLALLAAVVALWGAGQTINIMTLGGLTLAIGILVDESTVAIENIHTHLSRGKTRARAVVDAVSEVAVPMMLAMLCILAVFAPSFLMVGVGRALFVPLALSVGFAMAASYVLALTFVPILYTWIGGEHHGSREGGFFDRVRNGYGGLVSTFVRLRWVVLAVYLVISGAVVYVVGGALGTEIFPSADSGQIQVRLRAPTGTRVERTEAMALKVLDSIAQDVGPDNVVASLGFVGSQPSSYPVNLIHLWTSGPHEAVLLISMKPERKVSTAELQELLRRKIGEIAPGTLVSFEAADLVNQVMSFGSPTPIEVAVTGANLTVSRQYADKLKAEMAKVASLRDLQFGQALDYPVLQVQIDRERAGQLGVTVENIGRSLVAATSSSRFVTPNYWADPNTGIAYQVQVEIPQHTMASVDDVLNVPVMQNGAPRPLLSDVATVSQQTAIGEYNRYNQQRMITLTANVSGEDLGSASNEVFAAIARTGDPPTGVTVSVRGQVAPMQQTLDGLRSGLALAIVAIFLLLAAYFQSLKVALIVVGTIPAVIAGVALSLFVTGSTLNVQSFMGAIMAIGVAVANAILLATFAEQYRQEGAAAGPAAIRGATSRLRPILMTTFAMIAGMIPTAMGAEQLAPLGRAVIGGLAASTVATLLVLPALFALVQGRAGAASPSLDPDDVMSRHHSGEQA
ncbi:MAG: acriflavin resistance protein [Acidobacteria bacterium RIFCSPLOWO2_02_FULL_67_21]|nr:MAG: acriflavin resistance protein [Acidobacteria bacterium RIFCSPLOWO2_02_FULL_67_21]